MTRRQPPNLRFEEAKKYLENWKSELPKSYLCNLVHSTVVVEFFERLLRNQHGGVTVNLQPDFAKQKGLSKSLTYAENLDDFKKNLVNQPSRQTEDTHVSSFGWLRQLVSQKKIRYQDDKYDLDLSYITDRIIAMGFPSKNIEGFYRNRMVHVQQFFDSYHKNHYQVFNLCSERDYKPGKFERVVKIPFDDHNCPTLDQMMQLCESASQFLDADPENVVAIHCKAGKGRTGMMVAALLVYRYYNKGVDATSALEFFAQRRTHNKKGVTIPSQIRFVYYFEKVFTKQISEVKLRTPRVLKMVRLHTAPNFDIQGGCDPWFTLTSHEVGYNSTIDNEVHHAKPDSVTEFKVYVSIEGEARFEFFNQDPLGSQKMFYFWIHVGFVEADQMVLGLQDLDGNAKKYGTKSNYFDPNLKVELIFEPVGGEDVAKLHESTDKLRSSLEIHDPNLVKVSGTKSARADVKL